MKRGIITMKRVRTLLLALAMAFAVILACPSKALAGTKVESTTKLILSGEITREEIEPYANDWNITTIVASQGTVLPEDSGNLFAKFKAAYFDLTKADFSNVKSAWRMFAECKYVTRIDLSNVAMPKLEDMTAMFYNCNLLSTLSLTGIQTPSLTNIACMFQGCSNLKQVDLSGLNTSKVINMQAVFQGCGSLEELDLSKFVTSNVFSFSDMFSSCHELTKLDLSSFDVSNATELKCMFSYCEGLESIEFGTWNTAKVTDMQAMFTQCEHLKELDLSSFDTKSLEKCPYMFLGCQDLATIYVADKWSLKGDCETDFMFHDCESLVGGNGTQYDREHRNGDYARIDSPNAPGYFTRKPGTAGTMWSASASFSGMIELNFYCEIPERLLADSKAYVKMTLDGKNAVKVLVKDAKSKNYAGHPTKVFSYPIVAKQMRDEILFRLYDGNGKEVALASGSGKEYGTDGCPMSIATYCDMVVASATDAKMVALAKAMKDYGTASQLYFGYKADGLSVSNRIKNLDKNVVIEKFSHSISGDKPAGFAGFQSISLALESATALKVYLGYEENVGAGRFSYTVDTESRKVTKTSGGTCYLEVSGIAAKDLDAVHVIKVTLGKKTQTLKVSALSYAALLCKQEKNKPINLGKALYLYNQAAEAYFKK